MKFKTYQHLFTLTLIALCLSTLTISCSSKNKQKEDIVVVHQFPNSNWTFEEQVLNLDFNIIDTSKFYRIEFYLNYDSEVNQVEEFPLNVTIVSPDGMETFVSSTFNFDPKINSDITPTGEGSICNMKLIAFPKKKFNQLGKHTIQFYRKAAKYDNYGMNSLTLKVVPLKGKQ